MKKGQLHMGESVMVVVIFVVILIMGMVFYFNFKSKDIDNTRQEINLESAEGLLSILSSIAEVKCSDKLIERDCVDSSKLLAMDGIVNKYRDRYSKLFGSKKIVVEILYPKSEVSKKCTQKEYNLVDYPNNCNEFVIYEPFSGGSDKSVSVPVSIYFPHSDSYGVGRLRVFI